MLALDWASVTVGRFLAVRHEGNPARVRVEIGIALAVVDEWFPVRTLVADTIERSGLEAVDTFDSWSAVLLAEQLTFPCSPHRTKCQVPTSRSTGPGDGQGRGSPPAVMLSTSSSRRRWWEPFQYTWPQLPQRAKSS